MQDGFYLAEEVHKAVTGELKKLKDVLYFCFAKAGFDGKATKEHVKNFAHQFGDFMKANPTYKLPDSFSAEEVGTASVTPLPVKVAPVVVAPKPVVKVEDPGFGSLTPTDPHGPTSVASPLSPVEHHAVEFGPRFPETRHE